MKVWSFEIRGFFMRLFYCSTGVLGRLVEQSSLKWTLFSLLFGTGERRANCTPIQRMQGALREGKTYIKRIQTCSVKKNCWGSTFCLCLTLDIYICFQHISHQVWEVGKLHHRLKNTTPLCVLGMSLFPRPGRLFKDGL